MSIHIIHKIAPFQFAGVGVKTKEITVPPLDHDAAFSHDGPGFEASWNLGCPFEFQWRPEDRGRREPGMVYIVKNRPLIR
jgi:hypothetical protein